MKTIPNEHDDEIKKCLTEMEKNDYQFPKRFKTIDYIITAAIALICLLLLVWGAYL